MPRLSLLIIVAGLIFLRPIIVAGDDCRPWPCLRRKATILECQSVPLSKLLQFPIFLTKKEIEVLSQDGVDDIGKRQAGALLKVAIHSQYAVQCEAPHELLAPSREEYSVHGDRKSYTVFYKTSDVSECQRLLDKKEATIITRPSCCGVTTEISCGFARSVAVDIR